MQVMTASNMKTRLGEVIEMIQKEPIVVTKNNRPVGVFVSIDDIQGTYLEDLFSKKEEGYEEWAKNKVANAMRRFDENGSDGVSEEVIRERIFSRLKKLNQK